MNTWHMVQGRCARHGVFQARTWGAFAPGCPQCRQEELAAQNQAQQARHKQKLKMLALKRAGLAPRFYERDFTNYQPDSAEQKLVHETMREYADNFAANLKAGRCLLMLGLPGTGKTHLAAALVKQVLAKGYSARILAAYEAVHSIKAAWSKESNRSEEQALRELAAHDLLVLDEVGTQFNTETEKLLLFRIINRRYEHIKPTVLISNHNKLEIKNLLGERTFDRLRENQGQVLGFTWQSFRGN